MRTRFSKTLDTSKMYVIAHNTNPKVPVFLWKISFGGNFVTHDLNESWKFKTEKEANEVLKVMREDPAFDWKVYLLGIIA